MGKHRQISGAPSSAAATAAVRSTTVVNRCSPPTAAAKLTNCGSSRPWGVGRTTAALRPTTKPASSSSSPIGRSRRISWSAVKGPRPKFPLQPGSQGVAAATRPRRLFFSDETVVSISRSGRNGHRALCGLDIPDCYSGATQLSPRCCVVNGISVLTGDFCGTLLNNKNNPHPRVALLEQADPRRPNGAVGAYAFSLSPSLACTALRRFSTTTSGVAEGSGLFGFADMANQATDRLRRNTRFDRRPDTRTQCLQAIPSKTWRENEHRQGSTTPIPSPAIRNRIKPNRNQNATENNCGKLTAQCVTTNPRCVAISKKTYESSSVAHQTPQTGHLAPHHNPPTLSIIRLPQPPRPGIAHQERRIIRVWRHRPARLTNADPFVNQREDLKQ
jgi:hypothetical protein